MVIIPLTPSTWTSISFTNIHKSIQTFCLPKNSNFTFSWYLVSRSEPFPNFALITMIRGTGPWILVSRRWPYTLSVPGFDMVSLTKETPKLITSEEQDGKSHAWPFTSEAVLCSSHPCSGCPLCHPLRWSPCFRNTRTHMEWAVFPLTLLRDFTTAW